MADKELILDLASELKTPEAVQNLIHQIPYNTEDTGETLRSAVEAYRNDRVHCFEAAFLAAAILEQNGYPPLILDLESVDGLDHVLFAFKENGKWGAIGKSRDRVLAGRAPVFRSIRDLMWSYFDAYIDGSGRIKAYELVHLDDTKAHWRFSKRNVWKAQNYLLELPHRRLKTSKDRYQRMKRRYLEVGDLPMRPEWW